MIRAGSISQPRWLTIEGADGGLRTLSATQPRIRPALEDRALFRFARHHLKSRCLHLKDRLDRTALLSENTRPSAAKFVTFQRQRRMHVYDNDA